MWSVLRLHNSVLECKHRHRRYISDRNEWAWLWSWSNFSYKIRQRARLDPQVVVCWSLIYVILVPQHAIAFFIYSSPVEAKWRKALMDKWMFLSSSRRENWWGNGVVTGHPGSSSCQIMKNLHCDSCYHIRWQYPEGIWMVGSRAILFWVQIPALSLTLWLTLGKLPYLSMSRCPLICT